MLLACVLLAALGCAVAPLPPAPVLGLSTGMRQLSWDGGSLAFPSTALRKLLLRGDQYIPKNMIATKGVYKYETLYLIMARLRKGNPSSLVSFDVKSRACEPRFSPFPDLASHEEGNCEAIQNAVDMYLDHLGLLWVLDTGIVDTLNTTKVLCPPKVICINLITKKIVKILDLSALAMDNARLQNIVADYDSDGKVYLYVSDAPSRAILVYDVDKALGFRALLPTAVAPNKKKHDALYLALIKNSGGQSTLYATFLYGPNLFSIKTEYLRNGKPQGKITDLGQKPAPLIILGTNQQSGIYFRFKNDPVIYLWDTLRKFDAESMMSVYKSEDCFLSTAVMADGRKSFKVLESNFKDYLLNKVGIGTTHQITEIKT